jgi:uncharacterized membrane protein YdjX (TVP38/TMEM64 family)
MGNNRGEAARLPRRLLWIGGVLLVAFVLLGLFGRSSLARLHERAGEFNGVLVVLALLVLPLVGFPVSVLHAVTGAKFGWPAGMAIVAVSIAAQMAASYGIVRLAPRFFARHFEWLRRRLPPATHGPLTLFTVLLPGAPYFAQNYVLAVVGVPFRIFFGYAFPLNVSRSLVGVIFGEWSGEMTPARTAIFVAYAAVVTVACGLAFRRLRSRLKNQPPAAGGRKRPG